MLVWPGPRSSQPEYGVWPQGLFWIYLSFIACEYYVISFSLWELLKSHFLSYTISRNPFLFVRVAFSPSVITFWHTRILYLYTSINWIKKWIHLFLVWRCECAAASVHCLIRAETKAFGWFLFEWKTKDRESNLLLGSTRMIYSKQCNKNKYVLAIRYISFSFSKSIAHPPSWVSLFSFSCITVAYFHCFMCFVHFIVSQDGLFVLSISILCSNTSAQTCPLQPRESAPQGVRRCSSGVCRRTQPSSWSWRSSDSVATSPPSAKARRTSATSDSLRSSPWTRPSSCQVSGHPCETFIL